MTQQYIEPTRQARVGMALVGLAAISFAVLLFHYGPAFFRPPDSFTVCQDLEHYRHMMQRGSLFLVIPGLWLCFYAGKILRSGQSPAPGAWVLHRTVIKTGEDVTRAGFLYLALGILITVAPTYFWSDISQFEQDSVELVCPAN